MKYSMRLLGNFVDLSGVDHASLVEQGTRAVAEVESSTVVGSRLESVRVARIDSTTPHPASPTLTICEVDAGDALHTVVCGAPNARAGLVSALALPGTTIGGREIMRK